MLDVMRKHSRSFIIYVFLGIIIAVFVVNFGPQSAGCAAGTSYAGRVAGKPITVSDFRYAQAVWGLREQQGTEEQMVQLRAMVMDKLISRELMAADAKEMGFAIPEKEITDMLFEGRYLALGDPRPLIRGDDGSFDYERFSRYVRYYWGTTVRRFQDQQRVELLAEKLRQFLRSTVKVAEDEVKADFLHRNTQAKLDYVRFDAGDFVDQVAVDVDDVQQFVHKNGERIKQYYESNKNSYTKLPQQLDLQLITVRWDAEAQKAQARERAESLHRRVTSGEDFSKVAAAESQHPSKRLGGRIGWQTPTNPTLGPAVARAISSLKPGQTSAVIEDKDRLVIVKVLGQRQGDVSLAQAQEEIARKLLVEERSLALAREAAAAAIKQVRGGAKLEELFEAEETAEGDKDKPAGAPPTAAGDASSSKGQPKMASTPLFPRSAQHLVPRIGISQELSEAVFKLEQGKLAERPFTVGGAIYVVRVAERKDPDMGEWTKRREELIEEYEARKWSRVINDYAYDRCVQAAKEGRISVANEVFASPGYIEEQQRQGKEVKLPSYSPCQTLAQRSLFY